MVNARVGHTHNRLGLVEAVSEYLLSERISVTRADAIYGLLATAFRYLTELVDPEDVCAWLAQNI